jgi:hypothetical protein
MVDRRARDIAADAVRDFMGGSISNREYERRFPTAKGDPALWAIHTALWFGYSDTSEHTMTGKHASNDEGRALVERCVLFLRTDLEFQWPVPSSLCLWYSFLRLVGLGWIATRWGKQDMSIGDVDVWPFLKKADCEEARSKQQEPKNA